MPLGRDPLQRRRTLIDEFVAGGTQNSVNRLRREDPAGWSKPLDSFCDDHGLTVEIAVLVDHLTGVQPDAHLHRSVEAGAMQLAHLHLHLARCGDHPARRRERGHEPVAHLLDQGAAIRGDRLAGHLLHLATDLTCGIVTERLVELRRLDQVSEQHGDRALRNLLRAHGPPPSRVATAEV